MTSRFSAIIGVEINREITEDPHRQVPEFPAEFHWHIENQQTVNAGLIATGVALEMNVKRVAVAGVIIDCRRQLEVNVVGKSKSRTYLPRQHERVSGWNFLACLTTGRVGRKRWVRPYRIFRIFIVINELRKV